MTAHVKALFFLYLNFSAAFPPTDVDECQEKLVCGQNATCINTQGSYNCTCNPGFALKSDSDKQCEGIFLFFFICVFVKCPVLFSAVCSTIIPYMVGLERVSWIHCCCKRWFCLSGIYRPFMHPLGLWTFWLTRIFIVPSVLTETHCQIIFLSPICFHFRHMCDW